MSRLDNLKRKIFSDKMFNTMMLIIITAWLIVLVYPIIYIISSSFSSGEAVTTGRVILWPVDISLMGYKLVFNNSAIWTGYTNTIFYSITSTCVSLIFTILVAYPLSRSDFQGRGFFTTYFMIPMFFGGGLIPSYILVSKLGLMDTRFFIIICGALSISNMIVLRTAFKSNIPTELHEAAKLDGITDIGFLVKIVLPLSKATLAVITLYYLVGTWNSYFTEMIYLRDRAKYSLQLVLRDILNASTMSASTMTDPSLMSQMEGAADVMKYCLIIVSTVPMLVVYGFVEKFFEKGVMVGSVKG